MTYSLKKRIQQLVATLPPRAQIAAFEAADWSSRRRSAKAKAIELASLQRSEVLKQYLAFNQERVKVDVPQPAGLILTDCFPVPQWVMANSIFLNALAEHHNASIASYGVLPRQASIDDIYASFGASEHLLVELTAAQKRRRDEMFIQVYTDVRSPESLFNLVIDGVWIGLDIYESVLRIGAPTLDLDTYHARYSIFQALTYFAYFSDLIRCGKVKAVSLSHDCYIQMGTLAKIAHRHGVPVYYANPFEMMRSAKPHDIYEKFMDYPRYFRSLDESHQRRLVESAKLALSKRLGGAVGVDMPYQTKSAFSLGGASKQTSGSDKTKVLVATHCFYDNPHAYSRMTFRDFYEWMEFLGQISEKTDYEWYIKPHRDYLPGTIEILDAFAAKYPKFNVVNSETSFHQLREEGVKVALTCYGSIGHELPLLGYRVVNAAYNPHSAYDFNLNCYSLDEYTEALMNLDQEFATPDLGSLYEFYAVHHYLVKSRSLLFSSFDEFEVSVEGDVMSDRSYAYFMRSPEENLERYRSRADAFLEASCHYEYELRLPNWQPGAYGVFDEGAWPSVAVDG